MFDDEIRLLRGLDRFRAVDMGSLKLLAMAGRRVRLRPDEIMLRQGTDAEAVYIIMAGEAEVTREQEGMVTSLTVLGPGAIVGEVGVVLAEKLFTSMIARTEITALRFDGPTYIELVQQVPALAMATIRHLSELLMLATQRYTELLARVPAEG